MTVLDVLAAFDARDPEALRLAVVASLAVEIQPALLRRLRRGLVPNATPLSEALLWSSNLVSSSTPSTLMLRDDVLLVLRDRLRQDQDRLDAAREVIVEAHRGIAEVLRCEEDLVYWGLVDLDRKPRENLDTTRLEGLIRERLEQVLRSVLEDANRRDSLLAWSARALPLLPERVQAYDASATLGALVAADGQVMAGAWRTLFPPSEWDVAIGVRWSPRGIEVFVETGSEPVLQLPPIMPYLVEVEAEVDADWTMLGRVVVPPHGAAKIAVDASMTRLRLRSLRGDGVILRHQWTAPAHHVPGEVEGAPEEPPWFHGRSDDVARGVALSRANRLVSVVGLPGMGKTTAASAIARRLAQDKEFGLERAVWLSLAGLPSAAALRGEIAAALGFDPASASNDTALAQQIGGRRVLLVLDSAEDLMRRDRSGLIALVDKLLRVSPGARLLVTTREKLDHEREELLPITKLSPQDARALLLDVAGPRLSEADKTSAELGQILAWLDGHPLSIVLVARQMGAVTLARLWERLREREANTQKALGDLYARIDRLIDTDAAYLRPLPAFKTTDTRISETTTLRALGDLYIRTTRFIDTAAARSIERL